MMQIDRPKGHKGLINYTKPRSDIKARERHGWAEIDEKKVKAKIC